MWTGEICVCFEDYSYQIDFALLLKISCSFYGFHKNQRFKNKCCSVLFALKCKRFSLHSSWGMKVVSCTTASKDKLSTVRIKCGTSGSKHTYFYWQCEGALFHSKGLRQGHQLLSAQKRDTILPSKDKKKRFTVFCWSALILISFYRTEQNMWLL